MRKIIILCAVVISGFTALLLGYSLPRYDEVRYKIGGADIFVVMKSTQVSPPTPFRLYQWITSDDKDDDFQYSIIKFMINGTDLAKYDFIIDNNDSVVEAVREREKGIAYIQGGVRGASYVITRPIAENLWNPSWPFTISFDDRNQILEVWKGSNRLEIGLTNH